jgi:gamma-glutamylcyclotransferase (GGCT)/AIG2-like uncharacterized protein YtfP
LKDYRLAFNVWAPSIQAGAGNIEPSKGDHVEGTVFDLTDEDMITIDLKEGIPNVEAGEPDRYRRITVSLMLRDGSVLENVVSYTANDFTKVPDFCAPSKDYKKDVVDGAKAMALSDTWIKMLEDLPTQDHDKPVDENLNPVSIQPTPIRYFTYGSFMDKENLKKYCPSAEFVCKALIPNWEVQFNYYSTNYKGGASGIEPAIGKLVRGAVYEIPPDEMEHLDTIEGIPRGSYYRHPIMVVSEAGEPILVHVYRTMNPRGPFKPTKVYLKYMIKGAKALGLPEEYIETLQRETID